MQLPMKTIHEAMKVKRFLENYKIKTSVGKGNNAEGCYYYLVISERDYPGVMTLLNKHKFLVREGDAE